MHPHLNYFPTTPSFFSLLAAALAVLAVLIYLRILRLAYLRLGLNSGLAIFLLFASLLGSYVNIPVAHFPEQTVVINREIEQFGFRFVAPSVVDWPGTIVAINVGGALIPVMLSLYLLAKLRLWVPGLLAIFVVTLICHAMAYTVPGVGIAMPILTPSLATVAIARIISLEHMAPLAYISGSLGALMGADVLNLSAARASGAPVISIGGAGTFDGIFLTGIIAVALAGLIKETPTLDKPQPHP
jgi:uncharacterized membrane protein